MDAVCAARAFADAAARSGGAWCWLDGAGAGPGEPPVSYLGAATTVRRAEQGREREFLASLREPREHGPEPSDGFGGGWVVALGYEFGVALLGADPAPDTAEPGFALRLDAVLAIDHRTGAAEVRGAPRAVEAWWDEWGAHPCFSGTGAAAGSGDPPPRDPGPGRPPRSEDPGIGQPPPRDEPSRTRWRRSDRAYAEAVAGCLAAIRAGDAYVLCLTDTAEVAGRRDPLALYAALRSGGAAARGGVIATADRALVSASPERFLEVRGPAVATHPIKGTRPRGAGPDEDAALAAELARDPKERAENLMIVDLMRNDLSRVCAPGTVAVDGFLRVEAHRHVHQLVSSVTGELRSGLDALDAIEACFPGGSMTGAPKRRAVEILRALEAGPRGLYSGCFGWLDRGGDAELAMTIRGVELRAASPASGLPARALVGSGGGVTADSDPLREVAEKHLKARPLLAGLGAESRYS